MKVLHILFFSALTPVKCGQCFCYFDTKTNKNIFNCSNLSLISLPSIPKFTNSYILKNNLLQSVPEAIQTHTGFDELYLSGNPFDCGCDMTWMVTWLNNFSEIVKDYKEIKCGNGRFKDIPIHVLTDTALGCLSHTWTTAQKAGVAAGAVLFATVVTIIAAILSKSKEVKFLLFYWGRINTVPKDDKNENTDNKEFDAFFCYWYR